MLVFVSGVCGLFVVAFLFFRFRFFFTLTFFSHFHFFSHSPFRPHPTPPFPRKRESPCDARQRRGIRAVRRWDREIPAFAGMEKWGGMEKGGNGKGWKGVGMEKGREWKRGGNGKRGRKWTGEREWKRGREKDTFFAQNRAKGKKNMVWL